MTEAEHWVNEVCDRLVASGHVRLYKDLYKDLRARLSCGVACGLIEVGLRLTRQSGARRYAPDWRLTGSRRARAIAALRRLDRWAARRGIEQYAEENDVV